MARRTAFLPALVLLAACGGDEVGEPADALIEFEPVTAVYDCVADEQSFSVVTQTTASGLFVFVPKPFAVRTQEIPRVPSASGEKYAGEDIVAWTKGDEAMFEFDTVEVRGCQLDMRASIWEAAKLDGVDFRAVGNEPGWVLEIREQTWILFEYDYGQAEVSAIADTGANDPESPEYELVADTDAGRLVVTLRGTSCADSMSGEQYETTVEIVLGDRRFSGCGRPLH